MVQSYRVAEIFGPVIEGEGPFAGQPTTFIRFGGCDYRCSWCDSMHAVDPVSVRRLPRMTDREILQAISEKSLPPGHLITLSGGNPVLWDLGGLVTELHDMGFIVKLETQGSKWAPWLTRVDHLIWSPKPPSAGYGNYDTQFLETWRNSVGYGARSLYLKLVTFTRDDVVWARKFTLDTGLPEVWISCGTRGTDTRDDLGHRYAYILEQILAWQFDSQMSRIKTVVLPQLHVIAYLHKQGV